MSHWVHHLREHLGEKHPRDWTDADLRGLVRGLDDKVERQIISWKTAYNVWATATKMCTDSVRSKHDHLRCRTDNPAANVAGPERGDQKELQFLYPNELLQVVSHPEVPLRWRRLIAVGVTRTSVRGR